jgi:transcription antitermination factor NusG
MITLSNVKTSQGELMPSSARFAPGAFPEAKSSKTGVSVNYVKSPEKKWYVFRASYGREDLASDVIVEDGTYAYVAKKTIERYIKGKKKRFFKTLIPNLIFVYTTEEKADEYVNQTPALSFLSYYYNHFELDKNHKNPPLIIPSNEMDIFIRATCNKNKHLLFVDPSQCHYKSGDTIRVIDGPFKGIEGKIARIAGQQRVVVSISSIGLISTAYIPTAFIRHNNTKEQIEESL